MDASEELLPAARKRVDALVVALREGGGERIELVSGVLERWGIRQKNLHSFLSANLHRLALEQSAFAEVLDAAARTGNEHLMLSAKSTLFKKRGLATDTSLLSSLPIVETLRVMSAND